MENKGNKNSKKSETVKTTPEPVNGFDKLTAIAKTINNEVVETVENIASDIMTSGKEVTAVATKNVKEAVKAVNMTKSTDKIKKAAKNVNTEVKSAIKKVNADVKGAAKKVNADVKDAAKQVVKDVKANSETVKTMATKTAKEVSEKVDMTENVNKIKETAKKVNSQIVDTATELMAEVKTNRKQLQANMNKKAVEAIENVNITEGVATLKKAAIKANEVTYETAEKFVDTALETTEKWQNVANKAVKGGLKLAERQQEIVFTTLETVKGQLMNSAVRLRKMFSN